MARRRVAVLISGGGSNLQALIDADARCRRARAAFALVVSNRPDALGLARAASRRHPGPRDRSPAVPRPRGLRGRARPARSTRPGIELVCLAGFMRILDRRFVDRWRDRLLNIHPSLLPAFRGLHTHARALAAGVPVHGCTVHLVRPELDDGPILVQGVAPVLPGDDEASLAARVLELEHRCYPLALELLASGALQVDGEPRRGGAGQRLLLHPCSAAAEPDAPDRGPRAWFRVRRLADGVTWIDEPFVKEFYRCNIWHVRGRERDLLVDSGWGVVSLREHIPLVTEKPLVAVASHTHFDHIAGHHEFAERWVHRAEAEPLAEPTRANTLVEPYVTDEVFDALPPEPYRSTTYCPKAAPATRLLEDGDVVDLGDRVLRGGPHARPLAGRHRAVRARHRHPVLRRHRL